ncbi:MAG TPA: protocatechuate 3,4-dioxygenase [Ramlibacter sp.]|uniref:protocatechuate 3,4-dioxygenase n=1 Tax=Ramlibacter sp. TaxID=1917967 RepID=UPI002C2EB623|nr:protocatechuate 3,4-dioxygenase [Ramlibacter sp.]HVZ45927.1 protocatechuate 3,4-dioxygenase [Ramlibacter sp.]
MPTPQIDRERPIAGTQVFGLRESHQGLRINRLCHSLTQAANREAYRQDEGAYLSRFGLTEEETRLVLARDFNGLLQAGGNIFFLIKLASVTGLPLYRMGAQMRGESYEAFLATREQAGAT